MGMEKESLKRGKLDDSEQKKCKDIGKKTVVEWQQIQKIQDRYAEMLQLYLQLTKETVMLTQASDACVSESERIGQEPYVQKALSMLKETDRCEIDLSDKRKLQGRKISISISSGESCSCLMLWVDEKNCGKKKAEQAGMFFCELIQEILRQRQNVWNNEQELKRLRELEREIEEENQRLQLENDFDRLTGVHSRSYFYRMMEKMSGHEELLPISVVVGDVNNLKFTNDMFGHRHGDWLLQNVAKVLEKYAHEDYIVARCGGDEFNILMPRTNRSDANEYCSQVQQELCQNMECCVIPSISLGAGKCSEVDQQLYRILEVADAKMYAAKSQFKQTQSLLEDLMWILFARGYLKKEKEEEKIALADRFVRFLEWNEEEQRDVVLLTKYQDIGMTIVGSTVFYKKTSLNAAERREIRKHVFIGLRLALVHAETVSISKCIKQTHENYNGSGYPNGAAGIEITRRVYVVRLVTEYVDKKEKLGREEAIRFIKEQSGIIFEPVLAEKFLEMINAEDGIETAQQTEE